MRSIIIAKNDENQRLDRFLSKYLHNIPSTLLYKFIRLKRIKVNGKRSSHDYILRINDVVDMYINDEFFQDPDPNAAFMHINPDLDIVYEDENIMLVDKKPGMIVHPDENEKVNTLISRIQSYLYNKGEYIPENEQSFSPALCNRIDRNTGGIVIAAKNAEALRVLNEKIKTREIRKFYLCIVVGTMNKKEATLTGYLKKDCERNIVEVKDTKSADALTIKTKYKVLKEKNDLSLVEVELITGRTHQIRAHFASIGHPLLGDGKYGVNKINKQYGRTWQALYSYKLRFDFSSKGTLLDYLDTKEFSVKNVDFADNF